MSAFQRYLRAFSLRELVLTAVMAALGIALKPLVVPLAHLAAAPLMIPGGALAGGLYMLWLVVAMGLTGRRGTATLVGLVQAILVMLTGITGSHGIMSLVSYTLPGLAMDFGLWCIRRRVESPFTAMLACVLANVTGTAVSNMMFFALPLLPLLLSLVTAAFSGGVGGLLAWALLRALGRYGIGGAVEKNA